MPTISPQKTAGPRSENTTSLRPEGLFSTRAELALHGVYEISKVLAAPARLELILSNVLTLLSSFLDMRHGLIAILDDKDGLEMAVGLDWNNEKAMVNFERLPERAVGKIVTTKMPVVVENVWTDPLFTDWAGQECQGQEISFIGVPIKEGEKVIGILTIDREVPGGVDYRIDEDVRLLAMIANMVGQTMMLHDVVVRDRERLLTEQRRLQKELSDTVHKPTIETHLRGIIGESDAIRSVVDKIKIVARSNSTVLLRGESGTGKELFARAAHDLSSRKKGPFIKLNCAALPESVLESELFGHEKGAFTGAVAQRKGRFELADGGTLFLDEIGEISAVFQAKLLRVLQEGEFERVGGTKTLKVDVRLVTATNKNLEAAVARGEFRADLYYRINVVGISLPPLRNRREDIFLLASEFLQRFNKENATELSFAPSAKDVLESCYFPGNVRELENCVRRTATLSKDSRIVAEDFACLHHECLSSTLWRGGTGEEGLPILPTTVTPVQQEEAGLAEHSLPEDTAETLLSHSTQMPTLPSATCPSSDTCSVLHGDGLSERERLIQAMETAGWVQAKAARLLNLTPRQIGYALRKHDIDIKKF